MIGTNKKGRMYGRRKKRILERLVSGLSKTRDNIVSGIDSIFSGFSSIDDDFYEEIEEILIMGDIGVNATEAIIENLKEKVKENKDQGSGRVQGTSDQQHQRADGCWRDCIPF